MSLLLTDADRHSLREAQRALLHVPDAMGIHSDGEPGALSSTAWVEKVARALRPLFHTDHVYYTEPMSLRPSLTPGPASSSDASETDDSGLFVCNPSADDDFHTRLRNHFTGFQDGFSQFGNAPATLIRRLVRSAGTGAFHDAPLHDAAQQGASPLHQQVFRPVGIQRKLALSVPLARGEALLVVGFSETNAPEFGGHRHRLLELLLPAFEAGLRFRRHLIRRPIGLDSVPENAPIPLIFFDARGRERYRNDAFERLLRSLNEGPLSANDLHKAARALAHQSTPGPLPASLVVPIGAYRLRACPNIARNDAPGVLVFVEQNDRMSPAAGRVCRSNDKSSPIFPSSASILNHTSLTPRQVEVARFLAEGMSDQAIADALEISVYTARRHTAAVLKGLDIDSRAGVAVALLRACRM